MGCSAVSPHRTLNDDGQGASCATLSIYSVHVLGYKHGAVSPPFFLSIKGMHQFRQDPALVVIYLEVIILPKYYYFEYYIFWTKAVQSFIFNSNFILFFLRGFNFDF